MGRRMTQPRRRPTGESVLIHLEEELMIVRILADGQYRIDDRNTAQIREIARLEEMLMGAIDLNDEEGFGEALAHLIAYVHRVGQPVPDDELIPSDMIVPAADMTLAETQALLKGIS
jgi:hypothetical protein